MATPDKYSERNLKNSLATYLAAKFIGQGYLIYWHTTDVLQINTTGTGWYFSFAQNRATILALPAVVAAVSTAKGLLTVVEALPAEPRFITRLISEVSIGLADEVPVPALALNVSPALPTDNYEVGSKLKWRPRVLAVDMYARDGYELSRFSDWLALWLEEDTYVDVFDHDAGTAALVGPARLLKPRVDAARYLDTAEAVTYEVFGQAFVEYVA